MKIIIRNISNVHITAIKNEIRLINSEIKIIDKINLIVINKNESQINEKYSMRLKYNKKPNRKRNNRNNRKMNKNKNKKNKKKDKNIRKNLRIQKIKEE